MDTDKKEIETDDEAGVQMTDHLVIRDVESGKVLVNVRNTSQNPPQQDSDKDV